MARKKQDEDQDDQPVFESADDELNEKDDRDYGWDEGDPADRRKDPLRRP